MSDLERLPIAGRERVCCYVTRGRELLVFEHDQIYDDGAIGTHIIGGGWEEGETYEQTALRETFEESGLTLERAVFLGTTRRVVEGHTSRPEWNGKVHVRHYFWLEAPVDTPDAWSHTVSSGNWDKGHLYHFRFEPLETVELAFGLGEMLNGIEEAEDKEECDRLVYKDKIVGYLDYYKGDSSLTKPFAFIEGRNFYIVKHIFDEQESLIRAERLMDVISYQINFLSLPFKIILLNGLTRFDSMFIRIPNKFSRDQECQILSLDWGNDWSLIDYITPNWYHKYVLHYFMGLRDVFGHREAFKNLIPNMEENHI